MQTDFWAFYAIFFAYLVKKTQSPSKWIKMSQFPSLTTAQKNIGPPWDQQLKKCDLAYKSLGHPSMSVNYVHCLIEGGILLISMNNKV